jgi:Phage integrase, N-terminal SAM-like domain
MSPICRPGLVRTGATVADAAAEHVRYIEHDRERKPSTVQGYRWLIDAQILPAFGRIQLEDVTSQHVERWLAGMERKPRAPCGGDVSDGRDAISAIAETVDSEHRCVVLDDVAWQHIVEEHPEIEAHQDAIVLTVREPLHSRPDRRSGRMRYWHSELGPSRWLMVVVDFGVDPARVVTAYGNRKDPPGWTP